VFGYGNKYDTENHQLRTKIVPFKLSKANNHFTRAKLIQNHQEEMKKICTFRPNTNEQFFK